MQDFDDIDALFISEGLVPSTESCSAVYLDMLKSRDAEIDIYKRRESIFHAALDAYRREINILKASNDKLQTEVNTLRTSKYIKPVMRIDAYADSDENVVCDGDSKTLRRVRSRTLDKELIARLKNDRRQYAAVCDKAVVYWQKLCDEGYVDVKLRLTPKSSVTVAVRIACRFQTSVDPAIKWSFFESHWHMRHLQSNLSRSAYKDERKYVEVNRIFGLPDDAPFISKSIVSA